MADALQHGGVFDLRLRVCVQQVGQQQFTFKGAQFTLLDFLLQGAPLDANQACGSRQCDQARHVVSSKSGNIRALL